MTSSTDQQFEQYVAPVVPDLSMDGMSPVEILKAANQQHRDKLAAQLDTAAAAAAKRWRRHNFKGGQVETYNSKPLPTHTVQVTRGLFRKRVEEVICTNIVPGEEHVVYAIPSTDTQYDYRPWLTDDGQVIRLSPIEELLRLKVDDLMRTLHSYTLAVPYARRSSLERIEECIVRLNQLWTDPDPE